MEDINEEIKKIESNSIIKDIEWLLKGKNHGLSDTNDVLRYLLKKTVELEEKIITQQK